MVAVEPGVFGREPRGTGWLVDPFSMSIKHEGWEDRSKLNPIKKRQIDVGGGHNEGPEEK